MKVLFVCLGNICRSPTAEGVFRRYVEQAGLSDKISIDSAGTSDWHIDKTPDPRTQAAAAKRGYDLSTLRGRQASVEDFTEFDLILAMDKSNLDNLQRMASPEQRQKLKLFMEYSKNYDDDEVPDPYYGLGHGFDLVLDMVEDASKGLVDELKSKLKEN